MIPYTRITADDWGMSPAVNEGILDLVQKGVVKRVSLLADAPFLSHKLDELLKEKAELGLHFDLTFQNREKLLVQLIKGSQHFERECNRQLDMLKVAGVAVSYVDGHQHVHLLPIVAKGVARAMERRGIRIVRNPYSASLWLSNKYLINCLSLMTIATYKKHGIVPSECLYPLKNAHKSPEALRKFLNQGPKKEFIVHPATKNDFAEVGCTDPYQEGRVQEYKNLLALTEISAW